MQVFLPFPDIKKSIQTLDKIRLWKQVLEAHQLISVIEGKKQGYRNHPCTKMYSKYPEFLKAYYNTALAEWVLIGRTNYKPIEIKEVVYPEWYGDDDFHKSHRSNLLRKAVDDYNGIGSNGLPKKISAELWNKLISNNINTSNTPINLEYLWPV